MTTRWWWWVLALAPAFAGAVSLNLDPSGDFRSSGLIAGVSISIGLIATILLLRAPWRGRRGLGRWVSVIPGLLMGMISLLGLSQGLPEFFQARGLFIDVDSVGPVKVLAHDDAAVILGNDREGGFIWISENGSNWTAFDDEALAELEIVDGYANDSSVVVIGQSTEAEGVVLVSENGRLYEEAGRFSNSEYGTIPQAATPYMTGLIVISEIYGNDVEFYTSDDYRTWTPAQPSPVFDDGESARDVACSGEVCVGVGFLDATYRSELEANAGVVWTSASGGDFQPVDHDFNTESLDAIVWNTSWFVAVANSADDRGLAWHSSDGIDWRPLSGPFNQMVIDGVEAIDNALFVFGRNPISGDLIIWTSEDNTNWSEAVIATGLSTGSEVRSVSSGETGLIAVGINAETFDTLVWISLDGDDWQQTAVLTTH